MDTFDGRSPRRSASGDTDPSEDVTERGSTVAGTAGRSALPSTVGITPDRCETEAEQTIGSHRNDHPSSDSSQLLRSDRYVCLGELGRGGWGVVQRVLDRQLEREVAVKRIQARGRLSQTERDQFLHEALITSGLQHPGVVPIHELVTQGDGETFYVMKLLEGDTLRRHIREVHGKLPAGRWNRHDLVLAIHPLLQRFVDVCHAVAYAHGRGVIHRDLKPTNVMAGEFGETIVVDWGLARYVIEDGDDSTIQGGASGQPSRASRSSAISESQGSVIGTPTYMSPEQARGDIESLSYPCDIYSLGAMLYEIVAGRHAQSGLSVRDVISRVKQGVVTPIEEAQPAVPRALAAIIRKAMATDPNHRYPAVESLADDVQRFMSGDCVSVYEENVLERGFRWGRRHRAVAITVALAGVLLLIGSWISTGIIRSAHRAERKARIEAEQAHRAAIHRMVEARDAADAWLVDLSGALEYHPALAPARQELLTQARNQYERLLQDRIDCSTGSELERQSVLERARCFLRLGDLCRLTDDRERSLQCFAAAQRLLASLVSDNPPIRLVSRSRPMNDQDFRPTLEDAARLEHLNAFVGVALATDTPISPRNLMAAREQLGLWLPFDPPQTISISNDFLLRAVAARVRLETVSERLTRSPQESSSWPDEQRYRNSVAWAIWAELQVDTPKFRQLAETVSVGLCERLESLGRWEAAETAWGELIRLLARRIEDHGERTDWLQSLAHAKLRRAEIATRSVELEKAVKGYRESIRDLETAWGLTDADAFFRVNLATAENNLGRLLARSGDEGHEAERLIERSIQTYTGLLRGSVTPDLLRRLAQSHISMAIVLRQADKRDAEPWRQHLQQADLAYRILGDHDGLTESDRLDWADTLLMSAAEDGSSERFDSARSVLASIDEASLTRADLSRLESLKARLP